MSVMSVKQTLNIIKTILQKGMVGRDHRGSSVPSSLLKQGHHHSFKLKLTYMLTVHKSADHFFLYQNTNFPVLKFLKIMI